MLERITEKEAVAVEDVMVVEAVLVTEKGVGGGGGGDEERRRRRRRYSEYIPRILYIYLFSGHKESGQ